MGSDGMKGVVTCDVTLMLGSWLGGVGWDEEGGIVFMHVAYYVMLRGG